MRKHANINYTRDEYDHTVHHHQSPRYIYLVRVTIPYPALALYFPLLAVAVLCIDCCDHETDIQHINRESRQTDSQTGMTDRQTVGQSVRQAVRQAGSRPARQSGS